MCLKFLWSDEDKNKWLKDKPDAIAAYKVVIVRTKSNNLWPPVFNTFPYKETNRLKDRTTTAPEIYASYGKNIRAIAPTRYVAGYHLFLTEHGAKRWATSRNQPREHVVKCTIPKNQIIAVGKQMDCMVIVTKEFTFIEGDEYFKKS